MLTTVLVVAVALLGSANPVLAAGETQEVVIALNADTVQKGYTVESVDRLARVGITPRLFDSSVTVTVRQLPTYPEPPAGKTLRSNVYEYDITGGAELRSQRPLWLSVKMTGDVASGKTFGLYAYENNRWSRLPSKIDTATGLVRGISQFRASALAVLEEEDVQVSLSGTALTRGFYVEDAYAEFGLGIMPETFSEPVNVRIARLSVIGEVFPVNTEFSSGAIFSYEITGANVLPSRMIGLSGKYTSDTRTKKSFYLWNEAEKQWKPIPGSDDRATDTVRASTLTTAGKVAILDNAQVVEGQATYYHSRGANDASTHLYKEGTVLRVTNRDTGQSVTVKVAGTWANTHSETERVIDLSKTAFQKIASTFRGVANVRVEVVE